jgi:hypothetical protein
LSAPVTVRAICHPSAEITSGSGQGIDCSTALAGGAVVFVVSIREKPRICTWTIRLIYIARIIFMTYAYDDVEVI